MTEARTPSRVLTDTSYTRAVRPSSSSRQTSSNSVPPARSLWPSANLRMIWSGVCRGRLVMGAVLLPLVGATDDRLPD